MLPSSSITSLPREARALTAQGDETAAAVLDLYYQPQGSLFPAPSDADGFDELAEALRHMKWPDAESAKLLRAYKTERASGRDIPIYMLTRWVLAHPAGGAADSVINCIEVEPPDEVDIIRALPRKGSQKIVFEASWRLRQREVILKKVIGPPETVARILAREQLPHPLTLAHANIIETHRLRNSRGEVFLVEQKLDDVLDDNTNSRGILEAANLLSDIGKAVMYLHDNQLVHGDIKPDNIGKRRDRYILLDFGICRSASDFTAEVTPTGSLRTRAPELVISGQYIDPYKVDIWALGATVFNFVAGRFPLFKEGEPVPRVSDPSRRSAFERILENRIEKEWDHFVELSKVPDPLQSLLRDLLHRDPNSRISAADVLRRCNTELVAFLRAPERDYETGAGRFSALEEFERIQEYLSEPGIVSLMPSNRRQKLYRRLGELKPMAGFDDGARQGIDDLLLTLR